MSLCCYVPLGGGGNLKQNLVSSSHAWFSLCSGCHVVLSGEKKACDMFCLIRLIVTRTVPWEWGCTCICQISSADSSTDAMFLKSSMYAFVLALSLLSLVLTGLQNLILLNLEGCQLTAACLDSISGFSPCPTLDVISLKRLLFFLGFFCGQTYIICWQWLCYFSFCAL